ncbi:ComEC family competence protein [Patescibacteria group bacterium]|nr:ComEC family competence protein [Patescibacteria group bacterium]
MQGSFFYSSILAFTSGIFVRSFFDMTWPVIVWLLVITAALGLWALRKRVVARSYSVMLVVVIGFCFVAGVARFELMEYLKPVSQFVDQVGSKVEFSGVVVAEPEQTAQSTRLVVLVSDERMLVSTDRYAGIGYGDEITFSGKLQIPESFETEFGRTFNYPGYLAVRNIYYTVSFAQGEVVGTDKGNFLLEKLFTFKSQFLASMQTYIPEPEVGLGAGLLLGVKSGLGDELEEDFRTTGIIHIVVLSGANIMLVVIFVMYVLAFFLPVRPRAVVGIVAIVLFALLVGLSATVVRASIMAVLVLLALLMGRRYDIMRALCLAGMVMILLNPLILVYDVGFQLSFLATLGLIVVAPQFETLLSGVSPWFRLKEFFVATVATQIMILPLLLFQIGQFSVVSVLVNMLVLPAVPFAMLLSFLTGLLGFILPALATLVGVVAYGFLAYIIVLATWFADLPFAAFIVPAFSFPVMMIFYIGIGYALYRFYVYQSRNVQAIDYSAVAGWTIIEEEILKQQLLQKERPRAERSQEKEGHVPIFFR